MAFIMSAPMKIMKIIALAEAVERKHCLTFCSVSSRLSSAATKVQATPTPAPSVGVNRPP